MSNSPPETYISNVSRFLVRDTLTPKEVLVICQIWTCTDGNSGSLPEIDLHLKAINISRQGYIYRSKLFWFPVRDTSTSRDVLIPRQR